MEVDKKEKEARRKKELASKFKDIFMQSRSAATPREGEFE